MKRFTLLLSAMLLAWAANLWGEDAVYSLSFAKNTSASDYTKAHETTSSGISWDVVGNQSVGENLRVGGKNTTATDRTLTSKSAVSTSEIGKVVINHAGIGNGKNTAITINSISVEGCTNNSFQNSKKITISSPSVTSEGSLEFIPDGGYWDAESYFMITINYNVTITSGTSANNSYITINSVDFFAASLSSVPTPAFYAYDDVDDVENNGFYTSNLMVEIECDDYEAVIRYTTDGTEPTAESDEYTDGILFTNEFVTLRAKAFKGEDESYEATANYYHNSSLSVPYTTSEAITLYNALGNVSDIYVEGVVTGIPSYSASSSSSNYNITDGETILYIYKGTAEETSGLADIANLVEGDKVTVNGDITKYGSTIELNSGNTIVKWTENTNPVLSCVESVSFGNISSLVSPVPTKTLVVTAKNLTEDIAVTLSEDAAFVLDKSEFDVRNGGTIVITPVLTVGDNTATLTLTSGETSATVTLTATIKQAYTISWSVNGEVTSTSQVIDGDNLVLPASPEAPNDCASKVFVGWATTATVAADGIGIVFVDAATTAEKDATYYAVFATATESDESVTTYEKLTSAENFEDGTYLLAGYVATSTTYYAYTGQVSTNTYAGSVEVTVANDVIATKPETALEITITTNAEGAFSIYDGTSWLSAPSDNALTFNDKDTMDWKLTEELKIQSVGQTDRFLQFNGGANPKRFACYKGTMSNPYLFKKVVSPVMDYSEYTTTCDDTPSAIDNAAVETSAVKSIENGQLVILRDGVKYNAMGVRLQ